jgi:hypothetical protein
MREWPRGCRGQPQWADLRSKPKQEWPNLEWPNREWPKREWPNLEWPNREWPKREWPNLEWPKREWPNREWPKRRSVGLALLLLCLQITISNADGETLSQVRPINSASGAGGAGGFIR